MTDAQHTSGRVNHFFGAIQIDRFREPSAFRQDMDRLLRDLRETPPAEGAERVYFAGQKEFEHEAECARDGIPLTEKVAAQLRETGAARGVAAPAMR